VLCKDKPSYRAGKVQLIDASHCFEPRRKSIGTKRNDITDLCRKLITEAYGTFENKVYGDKNGVYCESKIFDAVEFGYHKIVVERPQRDEQGEIVKKKGKPVADSALRDTENVPLSEDIDAYFEREVLPYAPDAWIDSGKTKVGFEIPMTRYFYEHRAPEKSEGIMARITTLEAEIAASLKELFGGERYGSTTEYKELLLKSNIAGILSAALATELTGLDEFPQRPFNGADAEGGAQLSNILFGEAPDFVLRCHAYRLQRGELLFHKRETILKVLIRAKDRSEQVLDKRNRIVRPLVPTVLRGAEGIVIQVLVLGDLGLQRDILSDIEAVPIEQQRRKQSAHATVAVIEWVDAQEVVDKNRDGNERFKLHVPDNTVVLLTDAVNRRRRLIRSRRSKQDFHMTVRMGGADIVLHVLGLACDRVVRLTVEDFVQLQDIVPRDGDDVKALVNDGEDVAVAGDLLLASVPRSCLFRYKLPDPGICGDDALNRVRCLGALDLGDLHELFELLRTLFQIKLLLARFFIDCRHQAEHLGIPFPLSNLGVVEVSHSLTAF